MKLEFVFNGKIKLELDLYQKKLWIERGILIFPKELGLRGLIRSN